MIKRSSVFFVFCALVLSLRAAPPSVAGFSYVKTVVGIDEYTLDANGLQVLLLPEHSAPVVTFMVTYRVGSRNEVTGTTGATHLLEHLMFKGSKNYNREKGNSVDQLLSRTGALARRWWLWLAAALLSFGALVYLVNFRRMRLSNLPGAPPFWWQSSYGVIYAVACTLICLAILALFLRFGQRERSFLDPVRDDAYGIYVVHYIPVLWLQYALLNAPLSAVPKALIVFAGTLALSWGATRLLRRIPGARRVL